jgi:hypothetical protein
MDKADAGTVCIFAIVVAGICIMFGISAWTKRPMDPRIDDLLERVSEVEASVAKDMLYLGRVIYSIDRQTSATLALMREVARPARIEYSAETVADKWWTELPPLPEGETWDE